ncbi:response regulator transcription factor [Kribbella sp. NPDC026596]|uniref:response regulator transcription factor n=1 Tax=Kribbella sp. NPDC026596 TaxID=3155122 RepID=UPI003410D817
MIHVALVDDQAIVRAGLARILSPADGFEVVAECADGRQAVAELPGLHPDVVLMDIRMPDLDGIAATRRLRAAEIPSSSSCSRPSVKTKCSGARSRPARLGSCSSPRPPRI